MKQKLITPQRTVRTLALVAGVLGAAFVAGAPAAQASGIPMPHEVLLKMHERAMSHVRHVDRVVRSTVVVHNGYRRDYDRRYARRGTYPRYGRPAYGYPVVVGGYRPYSSCAPRARVSAYVGIPRVGVVVGVRPSQRVDRDDGYDRNNEYDRNDDERNDDRRQYDDEDDD